MQLVSLQISLSKDILVAKMFILAKFVYLLIEPQFYSNWFLVIASVRLLAAVFGHLS